MTHRIGMSQVKFKVRHNVLLLREFSVADMVRATGLNPESVRTELQRMKQEGLLTSQPHPDRPKKRGGPPALYRLTDDPEARLVLSASIEAFYPPLPSADQPTSRHYLLARQALDQAQTADEAQCKRLLSQAERDLEMAEQAEGGSLASEPVRAYLQYEHARLAYLRGERAEAASDFQSLREFFATVHDETMIRRIDEFLVCLKAWDRFVAGVLCGGIGEVALARCLLEALGEDAYQSDSPLVLLLVQLLRTLSQTANEKILAAAFGLEIEVGQREIRAEIAEIKEFFRVEQMHLSRTAALWQDRWQSPPDWPQADEPQLARSHRVHARA